MSARRKIHQSPPPSLTLEQRTTEAAQPYASLDDAALDLLAEKLAVRLLPLIAAATVPAPSRRGGESPKRTAARRRRDAALCALASAEGGSLDIVEVASRLVAKLRRYESTAWPRDRRRGAADDANANLFAALEAGLPIPGPQWLAGILLKKGQ